MTLAGHAAVAIWHDIAPEGRAQFYDWHGTEHMPERVAIPGFRRGRRYIARDADLEYFNLYEAGSPEILTGSGYHDRLNNPTPWTVDTVKHFRRVARSLCRVAASFGAGQGGLVATCRYDVPDDAAVGHIDALSRTLLPDLARHGAVAGAHLLVADADASSAENAESKARGVANRVPRWIVVLEGWGDGDAFADLCRESLAGGQLSSHGAVGPAALGIYQLQATIDRADLAPPGG